MGGGRFTAEDWHSYSTTHVAGRSVSEIYTSSKIAAEFDPKDITIRESCDSADNPNSTAIIIGLDVTGSMDPILAETVKNLGTLVTEIHQRLPVPDPHIMFMGIGDVEAGDRYPLQVTQFEADIRIAEQLTKLYVERGGGGNNYESYALAWYFAAKHTKIDCFNKRRKKGFIFTVGDEQPTPYLKSSDLNRIMTCPETKTFTQEELVASVSENYNIFHLIIEEGNYCRGHRDQVVSAWNKVIGQHARPVADHTKIAEIIVSILQKESGVSEGDILGSWDAATGSTVAKALDYASSNADVVIV